MLQQTPDTDDGGAAHTFIVRLRREPGSLIWRIQVTDVRTSASTTLAISPNSDDGLVASFAPALAAAIERLLVARLTKEF